MDRWYLPYYAANSARSPVVEDVGNILKISGVVLQGMDSTLILLSPSGQEFEVGKTVVKQPSLNDWAEIIRLSDDPQVFVGEAGGINKVLHRKLRYEISGVTQQKVWVRDEFRCLFCKRKMGEVQLTVDHFMPLELGGTNDTRNYISACRKCQKRKGCLHPQEWCKQQGLDYDWFVKYLASAHF